MGVQEFREASVAKEREKKRKLVEKGKKVDEKNKKQSENRNHKQEVSAWEKAHKDASKGKS